MVGLLVITVSIFSKPFHFIKEISAPVFIEKDGDFSADGFYSAEAVIHHEILPVDRMGII